jgi:hypothetical protein
MGARMTTNIRILLVLLVIISFGIYLIMQWFVRKNFYKKNLGSSNIWLDKRFLLTLFFPKDYIEKDNFRKGYLIYILSIFFLVLSLIFLVFYLKLGGGL